MDDCDGYIRSAKVVAKAAAAANQLLDFASKRCAAEARADNNEAEVPAPAIRVSSSLGMLHLVDDMLAKLNGIANDLKGKRMVGHSGQNHQIETTLDAWLQ